MTTTQPADCWQEAWEQALAALELDIEDAERILQAARAGHESPMPVGLGSWAPPAGLGPLPESLAERAQLVLARQLALIEDVASAAVRSRQHHEVARRMQATPHPRPLFVDAAF
ncbi:MAG: hypothetical protein ACTHLJ_11680 [Angustibacter sp.]